MKLIKCTKILFLVLVLFTAAGHAQEKSATIKDVLFWFDMGLPVESIRAKLAALSPPPNFSASDIATLTKMELPAPLIEEVKRFTPGGSRARGDVPTATDSNTPAAAKQARPAAKAPSTQSTTTKPLTPSSEIADGNRAATSRSNRENQTNIDTGMQRLGKTSATQDSVSEEDLKIEVRNGKIVLVSAESNQFAAALGLKTGDRLLSIDGEDTEGMSIEKARRLLHGRNGMVPVLTILKLSDNTQINFAIPSMSDTASMPASVSEIRSERPDGVVRTTAERKQAETQLDEAKELAEARAWPQAESKIRKIITFDPTFGDAWFLLGDVYFQQKMWAEAEKSYRDAVKIDPKESLWRGQLARTLLKLGRRDEAEREALQAMRLGLHNHPVFEELGIVK